VIDSANQLDLRVLMVDGALGVEGLAALVEEKFRPHLPGGSTANDRQAHRYGEIMLVEPTVRTRDAAVQLQPGVQGGADRCR
jgi:hypothetical protein